MTYYNPSAVVAALRRETPAKDIADGLGIGLTTVYDIAKRRGIRMPRAHLSQAGIDRTIQLLRTGMEYEDIAAEVGASRSAVQRVAHRAGLLRRPCWSRDGGRA